MILMIQKNRVTSGTLFNIVRPRDGAGAAKEFALMAVHGGEATLRLSDRRQLEHEAAARAGERHHLAAAGARQAAREREAEAGAAGRRGAADPGLERAVAELRVQPRPVVAHREADAVA